jgi:hypothetical protein
MFCALSRLSCPASPSSFTSPTNHPWVVAGHCAPFAKSGPLRLPSSGQAPVPEAPQGAQVTRRPLKRAPGALLSGDRRLCQRFEAAGSSSIPARGEVVQLPSLSSLPFPIPCRRDSSRHLLLTPSSFTSPRWLFYDIQASSFTVAVTSPARLQIAYQSSGGPTAAIEASVFTLRRTDHIYMSTPTAAPLLRSPLGALTIPVSSD